MTTMFLDVINMSITAGYVILAVILIRLLLKKAPKKYAYLLWSVVGFRLAFPVSFNSVFSFFSMNLFKNQVIQNMNGSTMQYVPENIITATSSQEELEAWLQMTQTGGNLSALEPEGSIDTVQILLQAGAGLWIIGIAVLTIYSVASYVKLQKHMGNAVLLKDNVFQSDKVQSPFIMGFVKPKIYIPFGLDENALRYVLAHERYHLKRRDHLIKLFAFALLTVHWFNPLCWLAYSLMCKDMEMSCDEKVLADEANISKAYSMTLLSFAANRRFPVPSPLSFGETGVKSRIKNVLNWKKRNIWVSILAAVVCIVTVIGCAGNPKEQESNAAQTIQAPENITQETSVEQEEEWHFIEKVYNSIVADVTHDGIADHIVVFGSTLEGEEMEEDAEVFFSKTINFGYVRVYDGNDPNYSDDNPWAAAPIWERDMSYAHAGNGQVSVAEKDGQDYLIVSSMWEGQGAYTYSLKVFALDSEGRESILEEHLLDFSVTEASNYEMTKEQRQDIAAYSEKLRPLYEGAYLVAALDIGDEKGVYISDEAANRIYHAEDYYENVWARYPLE